MTELSHIKKIMNAMDVGIMAQVNMQLTLFDIIELRGHIKSFEELTAQLTAERAEWKADAERLAEQLNVILDLSPLSEDEIAADYIWDIEAVLRYVPVELLNNTEGSPITLHRALVAKYGGEK